MEVPDLSQATGFDWDRHNRDKIKQKHGLDKDTVEEVFFNEPKQILYDEKHSQEEARFVVRGVTNSKKRLTVVFTMRNGEIRPVSARPMSRRERREYAKETNTEV